MSNKRAKTHSKQQSIINKQEVRNYQAGKEQKISNKQQMGQQQASEQQLSE